MSKNTAGELRRAADLIDDARTPLLYGVLEAENEDREDIIERVDDNLGGLEECLRELAVLEAVSGEIATEEDNE